MTDKIICCPSPARDYDKRRWDKWSWLADQLVRKPCEIFFVGTEDQRIYARGIINRMRNWGIPSNYCGHFSTVLEFMQFLKKARLIVTVNTFTMHLGMALDIPTVAIIGGTPARIVINQQYKNIRYVEDPALANWDPETAKYGTPRINEITVEQVMEQINKVLI